MWKAAVFVIVFGILAAPAAADQTTTQPSGADPLGRQLDAFVGQLMEGRPTDPREADPNAFAKMGQLERIVALSKWDKAEKEWRKSLTDHEGTKIVWTLVRAQPRKKGGGKVTLDLTRDVALGKDHAQPAVFHMEALEEAATSLLTVPQSPVRVKGEVTGVHFSRRKRGASDKGDKATRDLLVVEIDVRSVDRQVALAKIGDGSEADSVKLGKDGVSVLGLTIEARNVVFLVDAEGEVAKHMEQVKQALVKSISRLGEEQQFHVMFATKHFEKDSFEEIPAGKLLPATRKNKIVAARFLSKIDTQWSKHIRRPLSSGMRMLEDSKSDSIALILITDGLPGDSDDNIEQCLNYTEARKGVPLHVVMVAGEFLSQDGIKRMKKLAAQQNGRFCIVRPGGKRRKVAAE